MRGRTFAHAGPSANAWRNSQLSPPGIYHEFAAAPLSSRDRSGGRAETIDCTGLLPTSRTSAPDANPEPEAQAIGAAPDMPRASSVYAMDRSRAI